MATYTVTILDAAIPVLDKALTAQNATLISQGNPTLHTIDDLLTWLIEKQFGISAAEIKETELRETKASIVEKLEKLTVEALAKVAVAVDEEVGKVGDTKP